MSLGGLTTWHDLLHGSAPSFLGGCKRQHCKGVFHVATINPTSYFFFSDSISSSHLSGSQLQQPPRKMDMCFPNVFNGILLNTSFFWVQQIQQMSLQERSGLESLHLRKSQKLRPGSHASSASPAASVARTTATHRIPLFFSFTRGKWPSF